MARPDNRKRKYADEPSSTKDQLKKAKTTNESECDVWENPPEFYDNLSEISLTRRALRELNRRNYARPTHSSSGSSILLATILPRDLLQFSRHGGPDLRDLRGYPHPTINHPNPITMRSSRSSRSRGTRSSDAVSTTATSATTKSKKSGTHDRNFDLHLTEFAIHPTYRSQRPDLEEAKANLAQSRPSLSPSRFPDGAFEAFQLSNDQAKDEDDVLANVMPTILDDTVVAPKPDIYYGSRPEELNRLVRNELACHIVPSTMEDKPMAPNLFIEAKGPDGSTAVATRQIRYDGAAGCRGMHSLQNYLVEEPHYDGKPYTFGFTYHHDGILKSYAHHATAPTAQGGRPEYHITQMGAYAMTNNRTTFVEGASALRNTLDLAEKYRDGFIQQANARASQSHSVAAQGLINTAEMAHEAESLDALGPSSLHCLVQTQHEEELPDDGVASSSAQYIYEGDDSQDPLSIDPQSSLTTSFTSSFKGHRSRSKRHCSPPSQAAAVNRTKTRSRAVKLQPALQSKKKLRTRSTKDNPK